MNARAGRWAASLSCDLRLQLRHGLVVAGVAVMVFLVALAWPFEAHSLRPFAPLFAFFQATMTTFFFIAALVMFEKGEGTVEALVVTPLRSGEYLGSKVATLTLLAGAEVIGVIACTVGLDLAWAPLALGFAGVSALYALAGFILVTRFDSFTDFLMPGAGVVTLLQLPSLGAVGWWSPGFFWVWPTQPFLTLLGGAIEPLSPAEWSYALGYGALSLGVAVALARRSFARLAGRQGGDR